MKVGLVALEAARFVRGVLGTTVGATVGVIVHVVDVVVVVVVFGFVRHLGRKFEDNEQKQKTRMRFHNRQSRFSKKKRKSWA